MRLNTENGQVVLNVEDEGGGVAEHELANIFEPFYRAKVMNGDALAGGTGLGLAIASRAIAVNGGTLTARNGEQGLRVEIRLPIVEQRDRS